MFPLKDNIPTERTTPVTYAIILANVLVYFLWQKGGLSIGSPSGCHFTKNLYEYGLIPKEITHPSFHVHGTLPGGQK